MLRRSFVVVVFALATAVVASACGGGSPAAPTPTPLPSSPIAPEVTVSLSSLSVEARNYVLNATMSRERIQRMADRTASDPIRVFVGPYSEALVARATSIWEARLPLRFRAVKVESEGEIVLANEMPGSSNPSACGSAAPSVNPPVILGGIARIAIGLKPNCADQGDNLVGTIAHEIGHILGFGHTPDFTDLMSPAPWTLTLSPPLDAAGRFIYAAPLGARVVQ